MSANELYTTGKKISSIDVRISCRTIQLFSEVLYSSPQKAIEELVSNSSNAGANDVHVVISPDLLAKDAATLYSLFFSFLVEVLCEERKF